MNTHSVKTGELTSYGLACGYIQQNKQGSKKVELYREHNNYFVTFVINGTVVMHETFHVGMLKQAKRLYRDIIKANFS